MSTFGDRIDEFQVGLVRVVVRYGCARRDQYELRAERPFPSSAVSRLQGLGSVRGSLVLFTVDVEHTHQLTVAPQAGRVVIMPRMSVARDDQRQNAIFVARLIASELAEES